MKIKKKVYFRGFLIGIYHRLRGFTLAVYTETEIGARRYTETEPLRAQDPNGHHGQLASRTITPFLRRPPALPTTASFSKVKPRFKCVRYTEFMSRRTVPKGGGHTRGKTCCDCWQRFSQGRSRAASLSLE